MVGVSLIGRYRLERELGSGGMARVFQATDTALGRTVAVKLPREQYSSDAIFRERFLREARAAGRLTHPNIVAVYDVGEQDGSPFLVMQYVPGRSLKDELEAYGRIPLDLALEIVIQVAEALAYAHANGIVHRDIKPANILLTDNNVPGRSRRKRALLSDFGIARVIGEAGLSASNEVFGTVQYLAPERAQGQDGTPASDIYSLGVVLYELVTGRVPFNLESPVATAIAHTRQAPPPPRSINPAIPPRLEQLVLRALAKNPSERFPSAAAFASALRQVRGGAGNRTERHAAASAPPPSHTRHMTAEIASVDQAYDDESWSVWPLLWAGLGVAAAVLVFGVGLLVLANRDRFLAVPTPVPLPTPTATALPPTPTAIPLVQVPKVEGLEIEDAKLVLQQAKLDVRVGTEEFSDTVPAGRVIRSEPAVGVTRPMSSVVTLVPSKGPDLVEVPSVLTLKVADARAKLLAAGFKVDEQPEWNEKVPVDVVFGQDPAGGKKISRGATIAIAISKGRERVTMPDLVGMKEEDAKRAITQAKLRNAPFVNYQNKHDLPEAVLSRVCVGCVLSTTPKAGDELEIGTTVYMAVRGKD